MNWFSPPKLSSSELQFVNMTLNQLKDTAKLINDTVNPPVFFGRLNYAFDLLLLLQQYEKYKIFKVGTPSKDLRRMKAKLGDTVDNFIDRAITDNDLKIAKLKGEATKWAFYEDFVIKLISAFDCAHSFWEGNYSSTRKFPHYTGPLFTKDNYKRVQAIYDSLDEYDCM